MSATKIRTITSDLLCVFGVLLFALGLYLTDHVLVGVGGTAYFLGYLTDPVEEA